MSDLDPREEQRLRALLDDAVSDVEPRHDLDSIRNRTKVTSMSSNRPWIWATGGAVLATAATVTAFAVLGVDDGPSAENGPAAPSGTPTATASPTPTTGSPSPAEPTGAPAEEVTVPVYYVGDTPAGPRLYREFHRVTTADPASAAVSEALGVGPLDPDYRSPWQGLDVEAAKVSRDNDVIVVDLRNGGTLRDRPEGMSAAEAGMAVEQLVYTAQAALQSGNDAPVQLLLGGERTDMVLGVPTSEPLAAGDRMTTLATVWITSPQDGDTVGRRFTVEGQGAFFEANVSWQLLRDGAVVDSGFTTARECCTLAPYSFQVRAEPGDYVLRVYDADMSGGEGGSREAEDTKRLTVR